MSEEQEKRRIRPQILAIGAVLVVSSFAMATMVDSGFTRGWSDNARGAWAYALVGLMLAGMVTVVFGLTRSPNRAMQDIDGGDIGRKPSMAQFLGVYAGIIVVVAGVAAYLENAYGMNSDRSAEVTFGAIFLIASSGHPWWLFGSVRRAGWFSRIPSGAPIKIVLGLIGAGLILAGVWLNPSK